jgi:hypothetical protein
VIKSAYCNRLRRSQGKRTNKFTMLSIVACCILARHTVIYSFKCTGPLGMTVCYMKQMVMIMYRDVELYKSIVDHTKDHKLLLSAGKTSNAI